jgi:hypothetical protein
MFLTIITDCRDDNAKIRQVARYATLFPKTNISFLGVSGDLEAAGNLIDVLDAAGDGEGVIALNVAPRHGKAKKWKNGTPFGYFKYKNVLIVCTIDGCVLSLAKKFGLIGDFVRVTDIPTVLSANGYAEEQIEYISQSQFRSFDYLPRLAQIVWEKGEVPSSKMTLDEIPECPRGVWWIDSFGNCKTTLLPGDVDFEEGAKREIMLGEHNIAVTCYKQLRSVPDHITALTQGSSGYGDKRFLELIVQGGSAAKAYDITLKDGFEVYHL